MGYWYVCGAEKEVLPVAGLLAGLYQLNDRFLVG